MQNEEKGKLLRDMQQRAEVSDPCDTNGEVHLMVGFCVVVFRS